MADNKQPDDKPAPTEEEVKSHNEAEESRWQGDYKEEDLNVPYKRDTEEKPVKDKETDKKGKDEDVQEETDKDAEAEDEPVFQHEEPASAITVEDPGEYQPADFSFEVTLKDGKKVNVSTPEEAEKLADDPDNFETPKQLMDFINKQNKMVRNLEKDYEAWEKDHDKFTEQLEVETQRRETVENFTNEMLYLVNKGMLPDITDPAAKKRWMTDETASQDREFVKTPGVKEQVALLNYFVKENESRQKAGVKPITSLVDAYNAWQMDDGHQKEIAKQKEVSDKEKADAVARKAAGSRIAGVSPNQQGTFIPKGIAVGNPHIFDRGGVDWET